MTPPRRGFVPYNLDGVPHSIWMKALWMTRGDTAAAKRLARLLDESILPIVESGEKVLGARITAMILLERGVHELPRRSRASNSGGYRTGSGKGAFLCGRRSSPPRPQEQGSRSL